MNPHDIDPAVLASIDAVQTRLPPQSVESEVSLLGGLLLNSDVWDDIGDIVRAEDFYRHENRLVFAAISALAASNRPADVVTVHAELESLGKSDDAGGISYLNDLAQYVPSSANIRRYAEIIRERAILRRLISTSDEIAASAFSPGATPVANLLDSALGKLQELQMRGVRSHPVPMQNYVVSFLDRLHALADGNMAPGIPTHIPTLDQMLGGGLKPGKQVIIAARPSVGKSSFGQQLCLNMARDGHACAFLSQEMGNDELMDRAAANIGRVRLDHIVTGKLVDDEWSRLTDGIEAMRDLPIYLDDQAGLTLAEISAKARHLKRLHGVKVIVLDYLQLCVSSKPNESRHHQLEELSRGIKNLAKQLEVTFITLSQLNREVERRVNGRPVLSDLKESGAIEEDADVVILLSRRGEAQGDVRQIVCDVPKNRQGRVGELGLIFEGPYQRWSESAVPFAPSEKQAAKRVYAEDF